MHIVSLQIAEGDDWHTLEKRKCGAGDVEATERELARKMYAWQASRYFAGDAAMRVHTERADAAPPVYHNPKAELIKRLHAATGPDRRLDADIARALGFRITAATGGPQIMREGSIASWDLPAYTATAQSRAIAIKKLSEERDA